MLFSDVLAAATVNDGVWSVSVGEEWLQGRSLFGGMQAAIALRAMRRLVAPEIPLRVLQMTFVAPVGAGTVSVRARVLRTGKNVTHVEAAILDGSTTAAIFIGVFGAARPSRVDVVPPVPAAEDGSAPEAERVRPPSIVAFAKQFRIRWLRGDLPFSRSRRTDAAMEVGMVDTVAKATEEHVVAIADVPPPVALAFLDGPAPGSSLTWTLEMLGRDVTQLGLEGWQLHMELTAAKDGYTSQEVLVCGPGGEPVALSRQSMVVFG
jgi:acyl-coenzyme A thioesterase PaaI-like protein